jgi:PAS domain S-box-containing protein
VVAEDNIDHQRVIAEVVRRLGHDVVVASDGAAGLDAVRHHRPALLIADIDMPHLDGFQLCEAIRDDPEIARTPVVLVTAYLLRSDQRLSATGALAVVEKPFGVPDLTDALRRHLDALGPADELRVTDPALVEALLDSVDIGLAAADRDGRLILYNRALRAFFGDVGEAVPLSEWAHRFGLRHHDGSPLHDHELPMNRALQGERVQHAEVLAEDRQGRPSWFVVNARPVRDRAGAVAGAVAAVHDVTAAHRGRQYQDCKNAVLKALTTDPDAADAGDRILAAIGTTMGWPYLRLWLVDEVTERLRPAAVHTGPGEQSLPTPAGFARGEGLAGTCWQRGELLWVPDIHAPGSLVQAHVVAGTNYGAAGAVPVRNGETVIGVITFFSYARQEPDPALGVLLSGIAAVVGAVLEHRRAEVLALHLAAATDEYIALVGHELRTPLTSIGSYVDLIAESPDSTPIGEVRDLIEVVQRNNARLCELVERLLDLAALESGRTGMATEQVDLAAVVTEAIGAVAGTAAERRIAVDPARLGPVTVPGDRDRLRQVVDALLSNAVKFSAADSTVKVRLAAESGAAVLSITDTGIGIPAAEQARLFRRLYRAGNARHSGIAGAGLGLALCRVVVERHRGTITLASGESTGTVATVRLPN